MKRSCFAPRVVVFRWHSSRVWHPQPSDNTGRAAAYIELPYEVRCTQLRKSIRISADSLAEDIPVQLYMAMGVKMDGLLADISVSGATVSR